MSNFKTSLSASVTAPGEISGTAKFETELKSAASHSGITVEVKYDTIGAAGSTDFNTENVTTTFESFRKNCKEISSLVYFRHYSALRSDIPPTVPMDGGTYRLLTGVYSRARFIVVLNGLAPGTHTTRLARRAYVVQMFKSIYSERLDAKSGTEHLRQLLDGLDGIRNQFLNLLHRQTLATQELHELTHRDNE